MEKGDPLFATKLRGQPRIARMDFKIAFINLILPDYAYLFSDHSLPLTVEAADPWVWMFNRRPPGHPWPGRLGTLVYVPKRSQGSV